MDKHELEINIVSGGCPNHRRALNNPLENDLYTLFGEKIKTDKDFAHRLWSTMTNTIFAHVEFGRFGFTYRAAGDVIATLLDEGDYMDWYCQSPEGQIDEEIQAVLFLNGWIVSISNI